VPRVTAPTLLIWGEDDVALGKDLTYGTEDYVDTLQVNYLPNTSHWVQQEEPEIVNRLILEHLDRHAGA
jgi:pimeloyl-ACP methyl ester carboxylesterase